MSLHIQRDAYSLLSTLADVAQDAARMPGSQGGVMQQPLAALQDGAVDASRIPAEATATGLFKSQFGDLAQDKDAFHARMKQVYGENYDSAKAEEFRQMALRGDYSFLPPVKFVSRETLGGGNGAYNEADGVIYLAEDLKNDPAKMQSVFVEEAGHHLDAMLNTGDSLGDEGELFRRLMAGENLSDADIAAIRSENDKGVITVDGKRVEVEFWFGEDIAKGVGRAVDGAATAVGDFVADNAEAVGDALRDTAYSVGDAFKDATMGVIKGTEKFMEGFAKDMIGGVFMNVIQGRFLDAYQSAVNGADKMFLQAPRRIANGAIDGMSNLLKAPTHLLPDVIGEPLREVVDRAADSTRSVVNAGFQIARNVFRLPFEIGLNMGQRLWNAAEELARGDFGEMFEELGNAIITPFKQTAAAAFDSLMIAAQAGANVAGNVTFTHEPSRGLTNAERDYLKSIYGDSLDLDEIRVHRGNISNKIGMAPHAVGNDIYLPERHNNRPLFNADGTLTDEGKAILAHEAFHVYQSQKGGNDYIHDALLASTSAEIFQGDRDQAYDWTESLKAGKPFEDWNREQQCELFETIARAKYGRDSNRDGTVDAQYDDGDGVLELNELNNAWADVDRDGTVSAQEALDRPGLTAAEFAEVMRIWSTLKDDRPDRNLV